MRRVTLTLDQLYRPQPGGIATYVRGLVAGLLDDTAGSLALTGLVPRGGVPEDVQRLGVPLVSAGLPVGALVRAWARVPLGVPADADVVHATSMAGPFAGGRAGAVHSVAMHDLLWRDEPSASTRAGVRFHEARLRLLARRGDVRILTSSPLLGARLIAEGLDPARLFPVRLGVDDTVEPADPSRVAALLAQHGVTGPFTLVAGTREPRKNLAALISAHREARIRETGLGPLVVAGPAGWGAVDTADAVVVGVVERSVLAGLYRDAAVVAYVPRAEGWGLPPVEALAHGAAVVASTATPSVADNDQVVRVDALDVDAITEGLTRALAMGTDPASRDARRASVASLTWRACALDHLAAWR